MEKKVIKLSVITINYYVSQFVSLMTEVLFLPFCPDIFINLWFPHCEERCNDLIFCGAFIFPHLEKKNHSLIWYVFSQSMFVYHV